MKLDITNAECIKVQNNLSNKIYYNICDGTQTTVGVGSAEVVFGVFVVGIWMVVISLVIKLINY